MNRTETTTLPISEKVSILTLGEDKERICEAVIEVILNLNDDNDKILEDIVNNVLNDDMLFKLRSILTRGEIYGKPRAINTDQFGIRVLSPNFVKKDGRLKYAIVNSKKKLEDRMRKIISNRLRLETAIGKLRQEISEDYKSDVPVPIDYLSTGLMPAVAPSCDIEDGDDILLHIIDANSSKEERVKISNIYTDTDWNFTGSHMRVRKTKRKVDIIDTVKRLTTLFGPHSRSKVTLIFGTDDTMQDKIATASLGLSEVEVSSVSHSKNQKEMVIRKEVIVDGVKLALIMRVESDGFPDDSEIVIRARALFMITVIPLTSKEPKIYATGQAVVPLGISFTENDAGISSPVVISHGSGQDADMKINNIVRGTDQYTMLSRDFVKTYMRKLLSIKKIKDRLDDRFNDVKGFTPDINTVLTSVFHGGVEIPDIEEIRKSDYFLYSTLCNISIELISRAAGVDRSLVLPLMQDIIKEYSGVSIMENWVIRCIENRTMIEIDDVNIPINKLCKSISVWDYLARISLSLLYTMYIPSQVYNDDNEIPVGTTAYRRLQMMAIPRCMTAKGIVIYALTRPFLHLVLSADNVTPEFKTLMNNKSGMVKSTKIGSVVTISARLIKAGGANPSFMTVLVDNELMSLEHIIRQGVCALNRVKLGLTKKRTAETSFVIWTPQFAIIFTCNDQNRGRANEWFVHVISSSRPSRIVKPYHDVAEMMSIEEIYPGMLDRNYGYLNVFVYGE